MTFTKGAAVVAAATALSLLSPGAAHADASISVAGDIVIKARRTLEVPIAATCDDVGQESSFVVVTVSQGSYTEPTYVEGEGDLTTLTCDSTEHRYRVSVPVNGQGTWRPGAALLSGILSYCFRDSGTLSCTTQAFIPYGTAASISGR